VIRLTSRATILLSLDGNHIRIPNALVFKGRIVNYSQNPARRFSFDIGIDPDADLEATRVLAQAALKAQTFVLDDPEELVWIENITESGAILRVTGWIDQNETGFVTARGDAIRLVKAAIEAAGVSIPDTTYRIRLEGAGNLSDAPARVDRREKPAPASLPNPAEQSARKSEEDALIPLVAAERREVGDLLARDAPRE
jgi:small-conductance mechanosensitive channel